MRIRYPVGPHQRVVGQPDDSAGQSRRTAHQGLLFHDQRLEAAIERGQPCHHAATPAAADPQGNGTVPLGGHRASEVKPRSAIGTSMVVLVFWIAGSSVSYGKPAIKPSTTRSKFEISPSIWSDSRMYSNPFECSPFCCRGRLEKS